MTCDVPESEYRGTTSPCGVIFHMWRVSCLMHVSPPEIEDEISLRLMHTAVARLEIRTERERVLEPPEGVAREDQVTGTFCAREHIGPSRAHSHRLPSPCEAVGVCRGRSNRLNVPSIPMRSGGRFTMKASHALRAMRFRRTTCPESSIPTT